MTWNITKVQRRQILDSGAWSITTLPTMKQFGKCFKRFIHSASSSYTDNRDWAKSKEQQLINRSARLTRGQKSKSYFLAFLMFRIDRRLRDFVLNVASEFQNIGGDEIKQKSPKFTSLTWGSLYLRFIQYCNSFISKI